MFVSSITSRSSGATVPIPMGSRAILTPFSIFHQSFSTQNILSGAGMTLPPMARLHGSDILRVRGGAPNRASAAEPRSERTERETKEGKVQIMLARDYCPARPPGEVLLSLEVAA